MSGWLAIVIECMAGFAALAATSMVYALTASWFQSTAAGALLAMGWALMVVGNTALVVRVSSLDEEWRLHGGHVYLFMWLYALVHVAGLGALALASMALRLPWVTLILGIPLALYALILARVAKERRSESVGTTPACGVEVAFEARLPRKTTAILWAVWAGLIPFVAVLWIFRVLAFHTALVSFLAAVVLTFLVVVWWVMAYYRRRPC